MRFLYHPITGAILNVLVFGIVDILVGRIILGLAKILFHFLGFPILVGFTAEFVSLMFGSSSITTWVTNIVGWIYVIVIAINGYQTFNRLHKNE